MAPAVEGRAADGTAFTRQGARPVVALIHGLGLNRAMWRWQLPALEPHFDVLTYDLLGHGASPPPADTPSLTTLAGQLAGLLESCGVERCALVGFSLGGMIARRFALDRPDRVTALAILSSPHDRSPAERRAVLERVAQAARAGPASTVEAALARWFTPGFRARDPDTLELVRQWVMANDPAVYPALYRVLAEGDAELATGLEAIACPTLVLTGEGDAGNSPAMARAMAAAIPGARLEILPGLRHMALAEAPERVNAPLLDFLRKALGV